MDPEIPEVGAVVDGYRFKGGDPAQESSWERVTSGPEAAGFTPLGDGWWRGPDGATYQQGRGGAMVQRTEATGTNGEAGDIREFEANAAARATLMDEGQRAYWGAIRDGYDPSSLRNGIARNVEGWWGVGVPLSNLIRDSAADRGRAGELQFAEGALRSTTGAGAPEPEVVRADRTYFPQYGESLTVRDGKDRLRFRALRQQERIGGDAYMPYETNAGPINPETGLPTYPGIMDLTRGAQDFGLPPETPQGPKPGSSQENPFVLEGADRVKTYDALKDGGWVQGQDGQVYFIPPGVVQFGAPQEGDEEISGGVVVRPQGPRGGQPAPWDDPLNPLSGLKRIYTDVWEPFAQSAAEQIPFMDEAAAGLAGLTTGQGYRAARETQAGLAERDRREAPLARNVGGVVGALAPAALPVAAPLRAVQGGSRAANALRMGVGGAGYGALYGAGAGEGSLADRAPGAVTGGIIGGAIAPVAAPATNALVPRIAAPIQSANRFIGRQVGRVGEAIGVPGAARLTERAQPNALASGVDRLAGRMGQQRVNALAPRGAEQRGLGMEPALIDALDDGTLGTMRALATRDTPARDAAVRLAEGRRANLPTRVGNIAREEISGSTTPALQMVDDLTRTRRANASAIDDFGGDQIALPPQVISALRSDLVQPALRGAAQRARAGVNPADAEAANRLSQLAQTVLDDPSAARLTVRESQDLSKALNDAATAAFRRGDPEGPVFRDLAKAIRDNAREASPGYANWLRQYGDDSDLIEAATTGRNLVSPSADPMSARSTEAFVRNAGQAPEGARPIMRAAGREAVETAASNPGAARTTLDRMAGDQDFGRRMGAIGVDAPRVQARARAELDAVTRAQRISPRVGSETATNAQDAGGAAGLAMDVMTAPVRTVFRGAVNRIVSRGFSDQEAEAVVQLAIDPARYDEAVNLLAQRMTPRKARNAARAIRYELTAALQSGQER